MASLNFDQLLEAGCHFGHLKRKWNPAMAPYIFIERNGIHIIDLYKTAAKVDEAAAVLKNIAKQGKKVLFVATKKQAKQVIADLASSINMPYVIERWPGGMLTNFPTIRKAVRKMTNIDKMLKSYFGSNTRLLNQTIWKMLLTIFVINVSYMFHLLCEKVRIRTIVAARFII